MFFFVFPIVIHVMQLKWLYSYIASPHVDPCFCFLGDSGKVTTVVATPGQGPDRPQEVSYTDIKVRKEVKPSVSS